jgi:hypothetical protein
MNFSVSIIFNVKQVLEMGNIIHCHNVVFMRCKNDISFTDNTNTLQMEEDLRLINKNLERHAILLYVPDTELLKIRRIMKKKDPKKGTVDFTRKFVRRIFNNGSFEQGGRFYGGFWQNIPREYRKFIRINYKEIVELDYSGLHINMLYAMKKLPAFHGSKDVLALPAVLGKGCSPLKVTSGHRLYPPIC